MRVRYSFHEGDRKRLRQALRQTHDPKVCRRALAVLLVAQGFPLQVVAELVGHHWRSISRWVHRYLSRPHLEALQDAPRSGRPSPGRALGVAGLWRALQRSPLRAGYPRTVWTVDLLTWYLNQHLRAHLTARTVRRRLKELGLRWKRPRYVYSHREAPVAQKKGL